MICNDSGPIHLAAAVNEKIISIFGPTNPIEKAPLHKKSIYLWKQIGYNPCYDLWGGHPKSCPYKKKCMNSIDVNKVYSKILHVLQK
ncbi:glycosyltransferase family 9 protein [Methanocaldococcus sp. 16A]